MRVKQGRLILPLLVAVIVAAALIGHAHNTVSRSAAADASLTLSRGIHAGNTSASGTPLLSPSPMTSPSITPSPAPKSTVTPAPATVPNPPSQAAINSDGEGSGNSALDNCSALQSQWKQSLTQTLAQASRQLDQSLWSLTDLGHGNAAIDTYNQTAQAAYSALLAEAKSAQCSLSLDAPIVVQHMH